MSPIVEDKTPKRAGDALAILPSGVMIAVTPQGVMLPEGDGFPARALDLDELELLEALAVALAARAPRGTRRPLRSARERCAGARHPGHLPARPGGIRAAGARSWRRRAVERRRAARRQRVPACHDRVGGVDAPRGERWTEADRRAIVRGAHPPPPGVGPPRPV